MGTQTHAQTEIKPQTVAGAVVKGEQRRKRKNRLLWRIFFCCAVIVCTNLAAWVDVTHKVEMGQKKAPTLR